MGTTASHSSKTSFQHSLCARLNVLHMLLIYSHTTCSEKLGNVPRVTELVSHKRGQPRKLTPAAPPSELGEVCSACSGRAGPAVTGDSTLGSGKGFFNQPVLVERNDTSSKRTVIRAGGNNRRALETSRIARP